MKRKASHSDSKNRFQIVYFLIVSSHLDADLQYRDKAYVAFSVSTKQSQLGERRYKTPP